MTLPTSDTRVTYPAGATDASATVVHVETLQDGKAAVLLDSTSCHPVDAGWPDQGADRAVLHRENRDDIPLVDCVVAATDGRMLYLGAEIPVRKGEDGWAFVVAHVIDAAAAVGLDEGDAVDVRVDPEYRRALSIGHTACHVASLALNRAVADHWTKDARPDALGSPDFDGLAIESSLIHENGSVDRFRLNKSLRRKGFTTDGLEGELGQIQTAINATLAAWSEAGADIRIDRDGERLTDRRYWACELDGTAVSIPCGGTHASSLAALGPVHVELRIAD
ncbi:MAG TPA: metal-dependent hydrolase, partial [Microbacteriaceae bacterium]|nr:metal-dependent hydrolase [Microbacteriaceae bacterium]